MRLTGFSIGLLLLPLAGVSLLLVAARSPHSPEALLLFGAGIDIFLVAALNGWRGWYVAGTAVCLSALVGYTLALTRRERALAAALTGGPQA